MKETLIIIMAIMLSGCKSETQREGVALPERKCVEIKSLVDDPCVMSFHNNDTALFIPPPAIHRATTVRPIVIRSR